MLPKEKLDLTQAKAQCCFMHKLLNSEKKTIFNDLLSEERFSSNFINFLCECFNSQKTSASKLMRHAWMNEPISDIVSSNVTLSDLVNISEDFRQDNKSYIYQELKNHQMERIMDIIGTIETKNANIDKDLSLIHI